MESEKNVDINIDPEEAVLSISGTFRAIGALLSAPYQKKLNNPPVSLVLKYVPSYFLHLLGTGMCFKKSSLTKIQTLSYYQW